MSLLSCITFGSFDGWIRTKPCFGFCSFHGSKLNVSMVLQSTISLLSLTLRITYLWLCSTASEFRQMIPANVVSYISFNCSGKQTHARCMVKIFCERILYVVYVPLVNFCGPTRRSYQCESPFFNRKN